MSISALSSTVAQNQSVSQTVKKNTLTQQDFLNLFVTQMRYQNPLEPIDNNQMATQMAQFGSLEALNNLSKTFETLVAYQANMNNLQAAGLTGKKVEAIGNSLSFNSGKVSEGYYQISKPGKIAVQILDEQGHLIRTIEKGEQDTSKQKVVWDGKNQQGTLMPDGNYMFQVSAVDEKGQSIPIYSSIVDTVTGVSFDQGVIYLDLGSKRIKMSDLLTIMN